MSEGKTARVALPVPSPSPASSPEPEEPRAEIVDEEQDPLADLDDSTTDIDLVHCRLNALPPSLARFRCLTRLCLFSDDGTLEELDCYDNKLKNDGIDGPLAAPQMKNLKVLDLSFNLIKKLPETLGDLAQLQVVYFVQNKISQIDARLGASLGAAESAALEELWLGKNKLTSLLALGAIELPRLRILSLQSNRITKIEGIPPSVEELYLSHNGVEKIEGLEQCTKLNTLDVGNNFITKVEGVAHLGETLEEFWVSGNKFSSLGEVLVTMEVLKKLKTVYLEANPCQAEEGANYRRKIMLSLPWVEQIDATYVRR
ncbi:L domain-like protein [Hymenopellis radicata]|nr:L domain-like protein [Hymenopellis radicata]